MGHNPFKRSNFHHRVYPKHSRLLVPVKVNLECVLCRYSSWFEATRQRQVGNRHTGTGGKEAEGETTRSML